MTLASCVAVACLCFAHVTFAQAPATAPPIVVDTSVPEGSSPAAPSPPAPPPAYQSPAPAAQPQVIVMQAPQIPTGPSRADWPTHDVSVTISPLPLLLLFVGMPALLGAIEGRVNDQTGIALEGGFAELRFASDRVVTLYRLGGSVRYYATGNFDGGTQLGLNLTYINVSTTDGSGGGGGLLGVDGFVIAPFVGLKHVLKAGFTIDTQLGVGLILGRGKSRGDEATSGVGVGLLLNLGLGWSF